MADHGSTPRHRRRRENGVARTIFDDARRAGLVQRHLRKLRHLAFRAATEHSGTGPPAAAVPSGGAALSSSDQAPSGPAAPPGEIAPPTAEAA
ncbi:hypothetical protein [Amycolatopsis sp. SID8362]|uniref:hypothetical protein n=1 Tax=Amycolatopsis sp. SID8362 TaxID=2690346 RepID=UPI00136AB1B9|nr:hypothetical protein [Amycolatopsis sp. SID8362]NBH09251.1 hypothetical protein [Amycolatopsis sp. SID8362]NED45944.1 hypothetical protein [Amycolatopsis sp. SID8362]